MERRPGARGPRSCLWLIGRLHLATPAAQHGAKVVGANCICPRSGEEADWRKSLEAPSVEVVLYPALKAALPAGLKVALRQVSSGPHDTNAGSRVSCPAVAALRKFARFPGDDHCPGAGPDAARAVTLYLRDVLRLPSEAGTSQVGPAPRSGRISRSESATSRGSGLADGRHHRGHNRPAVPDDSTIYLCMTRSSRAEDRSEKRALSSLSRRHGVSSGPRARSATLEDPTVADPAESDRVRAIRTRATLRSTISGWNARCG